jgi:hypothetical protein
VGQSLFEAAGVLALAAGVLALAAGVLAAGAAELWLWLGLLQEIIVNIRAMHRVMTSIFFISSSSIAFFK